MGRGVRSKSGRREPRRVIRELTTCLCPQLEVVIFVVRSMPGASHCLPLNPTLPFISSVTFGELLFLNLSSLICKMRIIMIPTSSRALMIMLANHLA